MRTAAWGLMLLAGCTGGTSPSSSSSSSSSSSTSGGSSGGTAVDAGVDAGMVTPLQVRRLITLGSSSTYGSGASSAATRYVQLLAAELGAELVNLGTGGQTVGQVQTTYLPQALRALDGGPPPDGSVDVVTFLPFTDFASSTANALVQGYAPVLTTLDGTHAWVVFGVPTIDSRYQCGSGGPLRGPNGECYDAALVADYAAKESAMRAEVGQHARASVAGVPQTGAQHPEWDAPDGHPNDLGHAFISRCFLHELRRRLGQDGGPPPVP